MRPSVVELVRHASCSWNSIHNTNDVNVDQLIEINPSVLLVLCLFTRRLVFVYSPPPLVSNKAGDETKA